MSDIEASLVAELIHRTVLDRSGEKVGHAFDVYLDDDTGELEWLAVSTGLFGTKLSFVPLDGAYLVDDDLMVAYDKETVHDAPRADADGQLSPEEESALYAHYGRPGVVVAVTEPESEPEVVRPRLRRWVEADAVATTIPLRRQTTPRTDESVVAPDDDRI